MDDQYIITMVDEYICYFKNGKFHREDGPAAYLAKDREKYENLSDKDLYKKGIPEVNKIEMIFLIFDLKIESSPHYYLNGERYDKKVFDSIINNKIIQNELSVELIAKNKTSNSKKVKI